MSEKIENTDRVLQVGPPLDWYLGMGRRDKGILIILYSDVLTGMNNGEVGHHLGQWGHFTGNPPNDNDPPEKKERARRAITEAEEFITRVIGFTPRQIADKRHALLKIVRGQKSAPFNFELF